MASGVGTRLTVEHLADCDDCFTGWYTCWMAGAPRKMCKAHARWAYADGRTVRRGRQQVVVTFRTPPA